MDVYSDGGALREEAAPLPVPGTYKTWRQIAQPIWAAPEGLRRLDDPALDEALARLDVARGKLKPKTIKKRVPLRVEFARKDEAKALGARWDQEGKIWWLRAENEGAIAKARELGFLA